MNKIIVASIMLVALSGCMEAPATTEDVSHTYAMPNGMEGCKVFKLSDTTRDNNLYVVRCPMSTSTMESHKSGKATVETNITVPDIL